MSAPIEQRVRRQGRILAAQALYQAEITGGDATEAVAVASRIGAEEEGHAPSEPAEEWARWLVEQFTGRRLQVDHLIEETSANWRLDRMARMDLQILRIGVTELAVGRADVPTPVAIDEAIEVARVLGSEQAPAFVNGVLDAVSRRLAAVADGGAGE